MSIPIVILASGRGSNFDALRGYRDRGALDIEIRAVISDRSDAAVLGKARDAGIPAFVLPFPDASHGTLEERRTLHGRRLLEKLREFSPRFLVLGGYMRLLPPEVIAAFRSERGYSRIVNIHPSLLPAFPGRESYAQAFRYGAKVTGVTVHLVDERMDQGPICAQEAFRIDDCQHETEVVSRGRKVEHRLFGDTLRWVLYERFELIERVQQAEGALTETRRLCVRPN